MGSHTTAAGAGPGDLGDFRVFRAQECPGPVTCRCAVGQIAAEFGVVRPTIYRHLGKSASTPVRPRVRPGRRLGLTSATAPPANWDGKATVPEFSSSGLSCCPLRPLPPGIGLPGAGDPTGGSEATPGCRAIGAGYSAPTRCSTARATGRWRRWAATSVGVATCQARSVK